MFKTVEEMSMKWMERLSVTEMERGGVYEMDRQKNCKKLNAAEMDKM